MKVIPWVRLALFFFFFFWGVITIKGFEDQKIVILTFKTLTQEGTRSAEMWSQVPEIDVKVFSRCFPGHRVNLKNMT